MTEIQKKFSFQQMLYLENYLETNNFIMVAHVIDFYQHAHFVTAGKINYQKMSSFMFNIL